MRLLTPQQVKSEQEARGNEDIRLRDKLEEGIKNLTNRLNALKDIYKKAHRNLRERYGEEVEIKTEKIKELSKEVSALEKRRQEVLIPTKAREDRSKKILEEAEKVGRKSEERESVLGWREEKLSEDMEKVDDLREELEDRQQHIRNEESRQEKQREMIATESMQLEAKSTQRWSQINIKETELNQKEKIIKDTKRSLEVIKNALEERSDKITQDERRIKDGYETLARSQKRLNNTKKHA